MATNTLLTNQKITNECLMVLENNLAFAKFVNREYDKQFAKTGAKIGATLNVRKPVRYVGSYGKTLTPENTVETTVPIVVNNQFKVGMSFNSVDLALSIDDFRERYIVPAVAAIANEIDRVGLQLALKVSKSSGVPTALADTLGVYLQAGAKLDTDGTPKDDGRAVVVGPYTQAGLVDNLKGLFNSTDEISQQYKTGNMGKTAGFKFSMDQNVPHFTFGSGVGSTILIAGAAQSGGSLTISGLVGVLNAGDSFTIPGVYEVNPQNRESTGKLRQFTVATTTATNATVLSIIPAIVGPVSPGVKAQYQNVDALPANGATLTIVGSALAGKVVEVGVAYHKNAFTLVTADLDLPTGDAVQAARASDDQLGISIRLVRTFDTINDEWICRLDVLFGWAVLYEEFACRIYSGPAV